MAKQVFNTLTEYIQVSQFPLRVTVCFMYDSLSSYWTYICQNVDLFLKTMQLTLLVFIQGPCTGNQQSLAHSRLWDAVVGFLHVFAHMQMKLSQV